MIRDMGCHGLALFGNLANVFLLLVIPPSSDYAMDVNSFMTSLGEFFLHLAVIWFVFGRSWPSSSTSWKQNPPENQVVVLSLKPRPTTIQSHFSEHSFMLVLAIRSYLDNPQGHVVRGRHLAIRPPAS
jgi:hypothetical protein